MEAIAVRENSAKVTTKFLYHNVITRFGLPEELISDQGSHFLNQTIQELTDNYAINYGFSTLYYP